MMRSANEINGLIKRACLGAGLSHGISSDLAEAGTLLCLMGLDGCHAMRHCLDQPISSSPIQSEFLVWNKTTQQITLSGGSMPGEGLAASDLFIAFASGLEAGETATLTITDFDDAAVLLARLILDAHAHHINLYLGDAPLKVCANFVKDNLDKTPISLSARRIDPMDGANISLPIPKHCPVTPEDWDWLMGLVMKTYVPASAQSRQSGAGAGETDND